jgi:hypothetical protein
VPPTINKNIQAEQRKLGFNDNVFHHRERFTIAQIDAGQTLLPAIPGYKYRIVDMAIISIGGAYAGATDVRILATQAAASAALLIAAVAGLTQNTLLRAGAANATIIAGGASFVDNDNNTAITISKTGGASSGATHADFLVSYVLVPARSGS